MILPEKKILCDLVFLPYRPPKSLVCFCGEQCCAGFDVSSSSTVKGHKHTVEDVANEAVNLLWNLW